MRIAVLVGGIAYETQRRLLEGIMKYADEKNINIFVFTCNGDIYKQSEYGISVIYPVQIRIRKALSGKMLAGNLK